MVGVAVAATLTGCAEYDLRVVEGCGTSADLSTSQGSLTAMLLSGMLVEANETGKARVWYESCETNKYFGVVETTVAKKLTAEFEGSIEDGEKPDAKKEAADGGQ